MSSAQSIYRSPDCEAKLMALYDARLATWPVPYESIFLGTRYGKVHVIASGPQDAPPILLLHAGNASASMWVYTVAGLNEHYRTYAVDHIGDVGKSVLSDLNRFPKDGSALGALYAGIMEQLGVQRSHVVGASAGGYVATHLALCAPERVNRLVLLSPAGFTFPPLGLFVKSLRLMLSPSRQSRQDIVRWGLGNHPRVLEACEAFQFVAMEGVKSKTAIPRTFTSAQLQGLKVPVLLLLGRRDQTLGRHEKITKRAGNIPDSRIDMIDTGHLMSIEQPEEVNRRIREFLEA